MKSFQFVIFWGFFSAFFWRPLLAQELPVKAISQVVVESNKKFFSDDLTVDHYDLKSIGFLPSKSIGNILDQYSAVTVRSYGTSGSVSTVSMHGTGSNHTQISWNGIPLNSPTTGQADLSLIPAGFIQSIDLINGASGSLFGSGTFGGSINLINEPDWNNRFSAGYSIMAGRYRTFAHLATFSVGNKRIQYHLSAVGARSQNNFTYKDIYRFGTPSIENKHNAYRDFGLMQNLFLLINRNSSLEAGLWYQYKLYEVPSLMGSYKSSNANQKDSLFRSFLMYKQSGVKYKWLLKTAWLSDFLNFTDKLNHTDSVLSVDSRIHASRLMAESDFRYFITSRIIAGAGGSYSRLWGLSNNYTDNMAESEVALYGSLKMVLKDLILNAGLRKEFYEKLNPDLQYSLGIRYSFGKRLIIRSSFSNKFRKPTFNEKYWQPGGNPELRPEKGRGGDITVEWMSTENKDNAFGCEAKISAFYQTVDNWIQWVMEDYLKPEEYKTVHAKGIETFLNLHYHSNNWLVKSRMHYNYNRSVIQALYQHDDNVKGNQLAYIPIHSASFRIEAGHSNFMIGLACQYTGSRETDESNNALYRLPAYTLVNMSSGWHTSLKQTSLTIGLCVDNLLNQAYEAMRSYPVPGRTWLLSLSIGLNKSDSKKITQN